MGKISHAQAELTGTGISSDEPVVSLTELQKREEILQTLLSRTQLRIDRVLNTILSTRVSELTEFASKHIRSILYELESNGGITSEELEPIKSLPETLQIEALIALLKKEEVE